MKKHSRTLSLIMIKLLMMTPILLISAPPIIVVSIDIKPSGFPNSINSNSNGLVPVAILGSVDFDVTQVDVSSIRFGPDEAEPAHDLTDPDAYFDHLEDVNDDGYSDLVFHFHQKDTGLASGDIEAILTGQTLIGVSISGVDSVRVK